MMYQAKGKLIYYILMRVMRAWCTVERCSQLTVNISIDYTFCITILRTKEISLIPQANKIKIVHE
jgi:hypothetical protein